MGSCFGRGLSLKGKSPCLDTGHRSLEKISDVVLKRLPAPPIHFQYVNLPEHSVHVFLLPWFSFHLTPCGVLTLPAWKGQEAALLTSSFR